MHTLHRWTVATGCSASWGSTVWSTACLGWSTTTEQPSLVDSPLPALLSKLPVLRKPVKPNLQVSPLKVRIQLLCKQSFEAQNKRQSWYLLCDSGLKSLWEGDRIRVGGEFFWEGHIDWLIDWYAHRLEKFLRMYGLNRHLEISRTIFWHVNDDCPDICFFTTSRYYISIHTKANNLSLYLYFCCFCILYLKWDPSGGDAIGGPPSQAAAQPLQFLVYGVQFLVSVSLSNSFYMQLLLKLI